MTLDFTRILYNNFAFLYVAHFRNVKKPASTLWSSNADLLTFLNASYFQAIVLICNADAGPFLILSCKNYK